ncbi:MAG: TolC family protein [Saprospiraceae bacterium]|nr:TolC family protein [Saprospiraceae bacterium]
MKDFRLLFCLALLLTVFTGKAQDSPRPMSLKDCATFAIENSPQVQTALLEISKNDYKIKEVLSTGLPQVNLSGNYTYNLKLPTSLIPGEIFGGPEGSFQEVQFGTKMNTQFSGEVNQLVFNKTFFLGLDATRKLKKLYALQVDKTKEDIAYNIAQLYYSIQVTQKQRNILQANLDQVKSLLGLTEKQYQNGFAKQIDVDQLRVNRINLENQIVNLALQVEQLKQTLKFYMAMPLDAPIVLTDTLNESGYSVPDVQMFSADFSQKTDLDIINTQSELNDLNVEQFKSGYWPTLNAFANYNYQAQGDKFGDLLWFDFGSIGLNLNIPVFDGFRKKAQIQQAQIDQLQLAETRRFTTQSLNLAYNQGLQQLQTNINNLRALDENRKVAEQVYRVSQNRFKEGVAPITEVLQSETSMREAQTNYLTTLLQVKLAEIDILNSKGTLLDSILK